MSVLPIALFAAPLLFSVLAIAASLRRYGPAALLLHDQMHDRPAVRRLSYRIRGAGAGGEERSRLSAAVRGSARPSPLRGWRVAASLAHS
jgi:hypothetical protein